MAAKYLRRQTWWIRFYHPHSGELVRASLDTGGARGIGAVLQGAFSG
jgi:hypothetical protein